MYQTFKGWLFIVASGVLLYALLYKDLGERQRAEAALRESEERFRLMFEQNPAIMMLIEPISGAIRDANQAAAAFYGYSPTELRRMNIRDINQLNPDEVQTERLRALQEERTFFNFEHCLSNGELRSVEVHSAPIQLGEENLLFSIVQDATERRKIQQELQAVRDRMQGIIESAMDAIISIDAGQQIVLANPAAEQMFGYETGRLTGRPLEILLPETYRQIHNEHIQHFGMTGVTKRSKNALGTIHGLRSSGEEFPAEASISQISIGSERIFTVILRDITERKQAEEQSQRQVHRLRALHDIDVAISSSFDMQASLEVLLRETSTQLEVDAAAILLLHPETRTLGYAAGTGFRSAAIQETAIQVGEGAAGRAALEHCQVYLEDLSQPENDFARREILQGEAFVSYLAIPLMTRGEVKGVLEIYQRSVLQTGPEWLDFLETLAGQAAIAIENAQLFESLHRSNTELEQRVLERTTELNRANAELERANRTKDEFLANMSHELRTPLNSILGLSESLLEQRRGPLNEGQQNSLRIIESSGRHLLELINDILDLSKIEAGMFDLHLEPVPVEGLCRSCLAFVKDQAFRKSISLGYTSETPVTKILADPRRLKQILINLLTNAVKFTPEHGRVLLRIQGDPEQDLIHFSVIDNGIGIAPGDLTRVFQPFVQVDSSLNRHYQGTGLGLALVQRLTDLHGGSVQVESEPGRGSRFTVNLACRQQELANLETPPTIPQQQPLPQAHAVEVLPASRGLILLAEDNLPNILTLCEYLESHGYKMIVAHNGLEAITLAETNHPDLILMDIQMPVLNGLEAIARLRQEALFFFTPIIALTALAMPGDRERCLLAGASEYLSKPVSLKLLLKTIEDLFHPPPRREQ